jgi:hypothetical protein
MQMYQFYESVKSNIFYTIISWLVQEHAKTSPNAIKSNQHLIVDETTHDDIYSDSIYKLLANIKLI